MLAENDHWVDVINALGLDQEAGAAAPVKPLKPLQAAPRRTHAPEEKRAGAESRFGTLPNGQLTVGLPIIRRDYTHAVARLPRSVTTRNLRLHFRQNRPESA